MSLADRQGVRGIQGLAEFLGCDRSKLYAWIKRGSIGDKALIMGKCPNTRLEWLETGEGEIGEKKEKPQEGILGLLHRELDKYVEKLDESEQAIAAGELLKFLRKIGKTPSSP